MPNIDPSKPGKSHEQQSVAVTICRDVYEGTLRLREKTTEYLRQFPKEDDDVYNTRLAQAVSFNAFGHSVDGLTGMVMRSDPELGDDVPKEISNPDDGQWQNIDMQGTHGAVFSAEVLRHALIDGHTFIFVDMQATQGQVQTLEEERRMGLRPYWVQIRKQQVLRWKSQQLEGNQVLTFIAWKETAIEPKGDWEEEEVERVRTYRLSTIENSDGSIESGVTVEVWRKREGDKEWSVEEPERVLRISGNRPLPRIPISVVYAGRTGYLTSRPPLLDLALENVAHYQLRSDRMHTLHLAGVPVPIFKGRVPRKPGEEVAVGPGWGIDLDTEGDAKYLEPQGNALEASRTEQQDIETRMAALGLSMLKPETKAAETARARELERSEKDSKLKVAARSLRDALENSLKLHATWLGQEAGGAVEVNMDFKALVLPPEHVSELRGMVNDGQLSLDTMWERLVAGEWLDKSFDPEVERTRIDAAGIPELPPAPTPVPTPPVPEPKPTGAT